MSDFIGMNLNLEDFDRLLKQEDLNEEPVPIEVFVQDKSFSVCLRYPLFN
jgi:hypothetical protein